MIHINLVSRTIATTLFALLLLAKRGVLSIETATKSTTIRGVGDDSRQHDPSDSELDNGNNKNDSLLDHPDRMKSFPGWDQPLPSAWYSGCK